MPDESASLVNRSGSPQARARECPSSRTSLAERPRTHSRHFLIGPPPTHSNSSTSRATKGMGPAPAACWASRVQRIGRHSLCAPPCALLRSMGRTGRAGRDWQGPVGRGGGPWQRRGAPEGLRHHLQAPGGENPTNRSSAPWWQAPSTSLTVCRIRLGAAPGRPRLRRPPQARRRLILTPRDHGPRSLLSPLSQVRRLRGAVRRGERGVIWVPVCQQAQMTRSQA
jgi:hypothetical protein